jgi:hydrogenase maturation protease
VSRALVIAYGNPLRGDDGAAYHVAERLQQDGLGAEIVCCQQLTPELAERLCGAGVVVFVDASRQVGAGEISVRRLEAADSPVRLSHVCTPSSLLTLARLLGGSPPRVYELGIGIGDDATGEHLSAPVTEAVPEAVERIQALIGEERGRGSGVGGR